MLGFTNDTNEGSFGFKFLNISIQKLINLKRLILVQSWGFWSLKNSSFGCNVARAFSRACSIDLILSIFGITLVSQNPQLCSKEKSRKLHASRSCVFWSIMMVELYMKGPITGLQYVEMRKAATFLKDGACYCYCAYFLRISRYSDFLWVVHINTGILLHGSKLCGESRT